MSLSSQASNIVGGKMETGYPILRATLASLKRPIRTHDMQITVTYSHSSFETSPRVVPLSGPKSGLAYTRSWPGKEQRRGLRRVR